MINWLLKKVAKTIDPLFKVKCVSEGTSLDKYKGILSSY